jgi:hypothetical protein
MGRNAGICADVHLGRLRITSSGSCGRHSEASYYVLIGRASLPYVNTAEVRLLTGRDPKSPNWIGAHADGLVSILLPGPRFLAN